MGNIKRQNLRMSVYSSNFKQQDYKYSNYALQDCDFWGKN